MADEPRLPVEKALIAARTLDEAGLPHAFGGAIALAYCAEPRGTTDIDLNLFVPVDRAREVLAVLRPLGVTTDDPGCLERLNRNEQVRLDWSGTWLDLFFSYSPLHDSCRERARTVRLLDRSIRVLSAEDLVIFKALFDTAKDWVDIEQVVRTQRGRSDASYGQRWVSEITGTDDTRYVRLRDLVARLAAEG
jgi:hypothetical protein